MVHATDEVLLGDIDAYLARHEQKSMLRFITCGSVDDGKSTLIGRLLYDAKLVLEDHLAALEADSKKVGTQDGELDFALLVDGLSAEREQGITIDVAYRFFSTERRKFIVADTPGHEQYTRNMATGASTADVAVVLVDARKGVLTQTRRHSYLVALLGIKKVVVAVNKIDLVDYSHTVFDQIEADYRRFASDIGLDDVVCIPISALQGDNITASSAQTRWYQGPTLLEYLEGVTVGDRELSGPFRMPVQWVNRPHADFRGFSGLVVGGTVAVGDRVRILPSGRETSVARIVTFDGDLERAVCGQSVTLTLADEVDVSRGDVIATATSPPQTSDHFEAHLIWFDEHGMLPGRAYALKLGARTVNATISEPKCKVNVNTLEQDAARTLSLNEIGVCTLALDRPVSFDPYAENRDMGGFILIDRFTNATVAAGLLHRSSRRSDNIHWQPVAVDKAQRAQHKSQRPAVVWFTGLSGAGKSTIADRVERKLFALGVHTYLLDGDNVRHRLNHDLGFTDSDRVENIRRAAEVAALMVDAGLVVLASFISPFSAERQMARERVEEGEFIEVFIDAPLALARERDPKGLYAKALRGEIANFTGVDSPYEVPSHPEIHIDTATMSPDDAAEQVVSHLRRCGIVPDGPPVR